MHGHEKRNSPPQLRRGGAGQTIRFLDQHHPSLGCASAFPSSAEEGSSFSHKAILLLLLLCLTSCRQYMANQPSYKPYQESGFFPDGTSARPLPEGVIPQGLERTSTTSFPSPVTMDVLKRGQERFNIFCTPCHDHMGTGLGMVARRGFRKMPPSFHTDELRAVAPGYFFDVITHGRGVMPSYAYQISVRDRWAIVAYIRALQLSFDAAASDVPPEELTKLEREQR